MPATESTWRDTKLLHHIFAVSGVVLTISTIWMFYKDHVRSWKNYQVTVNNIDLKMNRMRQEQFETGEASLEHERLAGELAAARSEPIPPELLSQFKSRLEGLNATLADAAKNGHSYSQISADFRYIDNTAKRLEELAKEVQAKRQSARAAIAAAEQAASKPAASDDERSEIKRLGMDATA